MSVRVGSLVIRQLSLHQAVCDCTRGRARARRRREIFTRSKSFRLHQYTGGRLRVVMCDSERETGKSPGFKRPALSTRTHGEPAALSTSSAAWNDGDGAPGRGPTPLAPPLQLQPEQRAQARAPLLHAPQSRARARLPSQPDSSRSCAGLCCTPQSF